MIVVAGEALIDLIVDPDGRVAAIPGGGPFNTARAIGRLGVDVAFLGVLSTDRFGAMLSAALASDGVDLRWATPTELPTTLAVAELDASGSATYRFHLADTSAPSLLPADVVAALAAAPDALHIGTLGLVAEPIASSLVAGSTTAEPQTLVMVDANCRPAAIADRGAYLARLGDVLARTDIVKVSTDDLAYIDPGTAPVDAAQTIIDRGPGVVLLTDGARAVTVVASTFSFELPVPIVDVVDTVGCGDAFGGAFLARWIERGLRRGDLADRAAVTDATALAIRSAALTATRAGADPPRRDELDWAPRQA